MSRIHLIIVSAGLLIVLGIITNNKYGVDANQTERNVQVILQDSTSSSTVLIRENYAPSFVLDSVTYVIVDDGCFKVSRNKQIPFIYPMNRYAVEPIRKIKCFF